MDINTQNSSGMMNGIPPVHHNEKKVGPIVGALIIVLILIIAALYFFGQRLNMQKNQQSQNPASNSSQTQLSATATNAQDIQTLQADLDNQLNNVDYSF